MSKKPIKFNSNLLEWVEKNKGSPKILDPQKKSIKENESTQESLNNGATEMSKILMDQMKTMQE